MDRPSRITARRVGVLVIVFGLILGLGFFSGIPGTPARADVGQSGIATATHSVVAAGAVHPSPSATPTTVSLHVNTDFTTYTTMPFTVVLNLTVNNSAILVNPTTGVSMNTWLWLNISDFLTGKTCTTNNISSLITPAGPVTSSTFTVEYLTFPLTSTFFVGYAKDCPDLAADVSFLNFTATVNGGPNGTGVAQGYEFGIYSVDFPPGWALDPISSVIFALPTSVLHVTPVTGEPSTYALYANYTGQYAGRVQLSVYNPTATAVVLSTNLRWNGTTPTVYDWVQTIPATYPYTLSVETGYGVFNSSGSIVVPAASYVYTNETSWTNSTLISGLSAGASGTILLVVGLVVGMIVAIVVGRRVWGGPKPAGPAQPWTPKAAGAANECSVCGRSFATPEELAEHSKSEHGMQ